MPLPARRTMELPRRLPALPAGLLSRAVLGAAALLIAPVIWIALEDPAPSGPAGPASPDVTLAVTKEGVRGGDPPRSGDDPHASEHPGRSGEHDLTSPGEVIARAAILGDADLAARWASPTLFPREGEPLSIERTTEWARALADLAGRTADARLVDALARYVEPNGLERRPGGSPGIARRIAAWLGGAERLAAVESGRRGESDIAAAIDSLSAALAPAAGDAADEPLPARLGRRATLDLARARIAAARVLERSSALIPGSPGARDRLLFRIGVGALLLDDRAELDEVLDRLSRREKAATAGYRDLLAGGRARLDGSAGSAERIAELLERDSARAEASRRLYPAEAEQFRRLAERGRLAAAVDRPAVRFEGAKAWAELGESARPWFDRSLELLRSESTLRRDLAYPLFLEARIALEGERIAGVSEHLRGLLDLESPPGLSREEIAALLVVVEERGDDLAAAGELRAAARETLEPLADGAADDPGPAECARALELILDLEAAPAGWLGEEGPAARLDELEARFARAGGHSFELEEARRLLRETLVDSARRQSRVGETELARATLERVLRLGVSSEPLVAAGE